MIAPLARPLSRSALALCLCAAAPAFAASFTGLDKNESATPPLAVHLNSDAARDAFVAAAGGNAAVRMYDFEALPAGPVTDALDFGGGLQATFTSQSTGTTALMTGTGSFSEFAISQTNYISSLTVQNTSFWTITFNQPLTAIGFYATDPSDWAGYSETIPSLQVVLTSGSGSVTYDLTPGVSPTTIPNASVAFFGVVDTANPFTSITLFHPAHLQTEDAVGLDNLMAVPVPEPESWVAMLAGLALLGWRVRSRR